MICKKKRGNQITLLIFQVNSLYASCSDMRLALSQLGTYYLALPKVVPGSHLILDNPNTLKTNLKQSELVTILGIGVITRHP